MLHGISREGRKRWQENYILSYVIARTLIKNEPNLLRRKANLLGQVTEYPSVNQFRVLCLDLILSVIPGFVAFGDLRTHLVHQFK